MPPPSTLSLRSVPHIGPLTPFPRHPQASTGGRSRRCFKDVLRTCQETLTYSIHLPWTLSLWLLLHLNSSTVQQDCLLSTLHGLHHTPTHPRMSPAQRAQLTSCVMEGHWTTWDGGLIVVTWRVKPTAKRVQAGVTSVWLQLDSAFSQSSTRGQFLVYPVLLWICVREI